MTIRQAISWARDHLGKTSSSPGLDAQMLLGEILGCGFAFLLAHDDQDLSESQEQNYRKWIAERRQGKPVSYLLGKKEFYDLEFEVREGVLVPRPDTEILVEMVLDYLNDEWGVFNVQKKSKIKLVDVGVGSGCIPISILKKQPDLEAVGLELSSEALKIARKNAKKLGMDDRLELIQSDLLEKLPDNVVGGKAWILVANLPYIPQHWPKHFSTQFEPNVALFGGREGVELYYRLAVEIEKLQHKPIALFFEGFEFQISKIEMVFPSYELVEVKKMTGEACGLRFELKKDDSFCSSA